MATSWVVLAASLAVASSQHSSPWQSKFENHAEASNANNPTFYQEVIPAQAAIYQASAHSRIAQEASHLTNAQHSYGQQIAPASAQHSFVIVKSAVKPDFYNAINLQQNTARQECPGCFSERQTLEDAIVVQASPKNLQGPLSSSLGVIPQVLQQLNPSSPWATLGVVNDGTPETVIS